MVYLYLFPHMRRQSTAVGASDSRRSVAPLSSYWPRTRQNTVRWLRSYGPIWVVAQTQPIRAQRLCRHLMKRSNHYPETLGMTVTNKLCKEHFLMIKTTNCWTIYELTFSLLIVHFFFLAQESLWLFFQTLIVDSSFLWLKTPVKTGANVSQRPYWSDIFGFLWWPAAIFIYVNVFTDQAGDVAIVSPPWGETKVFKETFMIDEWLLFNNVGIAAISVRMRCCVVKF